MATRLETYFRDTRASNLLRVVQGQHTYYAVGQTLSVFFPRLRKLSREHQPATVIFSGTATLSPELSGNPDVSLLPNQMCTLPSIFSTETAFVPLKPHAAKPVIWKQPPPGPHTFSAIYPTGTAKSSWFLIKSTPVFCGNG